MKLIYYGKAWAYVPNCSISQGEHDCSGQGNSLLTEYLFEVVGSPALSNIVSEIRGDINQEAISSGYLTPYKGSSIGVPYHHGYGDDDSYSMENRAESGNVYSGEYDLEGAQNAIHQISITCDLPNFPDISNPSHFRSLLKLFAPSGIKGSFQSPTPCYYSSKQPCVDWIRSECSKINNGNIPLESVEFRVLK